MAMDVPRPFRVVEAASAAARLSAASDFLRQFPPDQPITIVSATRGAADDLARAIAIERGATIGLSRFSLTQLAARVALTRLAGRGMAPATTLGAEAVAARVVFDAARDRTLGYFGKVAGTPGFPRALSRTMTDLRHAGVSADRLAASGPAAEDLAALLAQAEREMADASTADRAMLFETAASATGEETFLHAPLLLLDVAVQSGAEEQFVAALVAAATETLATCPGADDGALAAFQRAGGRLETMHEEPRDDLTNLRTYLFADDAPAPRDLDGSLEFFSAPGEGRECVEIARRILAEARRGVPFDAMAIFVRAPHSYFGLLEHALRRAEVPAWFDRGTRRPHPTGRAFLALLACASEQLSASRFAEYLSLGQVPRHDEIMPEWEASRDEALSSTAERGDAAADGIGPHAGPAEAGHSVPEGIAEAGHVPDGSAEAGAHVVEGTLRAPWRWEKLLVESAVIGQDASRWRRRLDGKAKEISRQIAEAGRDGHDSARALGLARLGEQLERLKRFALPIVETLAAWPAQATWGEWLGHFERLAPRVLRMPAHVLRVLADLRPMAGVGPIDLDEARRVLTDRLLMLESDPPLRRFGRVLVGTPQQARGRAVRIVFVPGLAERMFPQKPREDPLLLDEARTATDPSLPTQRQRLEAERLLLRLCAGAASERLYVSYPRIELSEARARVPSFYGLDVMRAATGRVPDHETLEERAREAGNATLAWPAPPSPEQAIDDQEHDLAVLRRLLDEPDRDTVKGHAHYLLTLNQHLRRSVIHRWSRGERRWSPSDGLTRISPRVRQALAPHRLTARAYSLTALQKFSACPYQFVLSAIYRLRPVEQPESQQRMDPLSRGSIFHEIQARFLNDCRARAALPVTRANVAAARDVLERVATAVAVRAHDDLAPAVERVWNDEIASITRDLRSWLELLAIDGEEWLPKWFEFGFGQVPGERDPASRAEDAVVEGGFRLHGAIDLVEEHRQTGLLRVTDHKTGRKPDRIEKAIVAGGTVLQPLLYSLAMESFGYPVSHGRLFYCTSAGSYFPHPIPLNDVTRPAALEVLQIVDRAIEHGFLAAAPSEDACDRCDFRSVCGPDVYRRVLQKPQDVLLDLHALRTRQ
jgi:CRISPR/Cas system-associated exonuclease Cas4 (RecB family)